MVDRDYARKRVNNNLAGELHVPPSLTVVHPDGEVQWVVVEVCH